MFDFLWNLHQQGRINELSREVADRRSSASAPIEELQDRLDKLLLINMALWSFIEEKLGVTEQQLADRVRDIDLRDGSLDGRPPPVAAVCGKCNRPMSKRHTRCLYCGGPTNQASPFAGV